MKKRTVFIIGVVVIVFLSMGVIGETRIFADVQNHFEGQQAGFFYSVGNRLYKDGEKDKALLMYQKAIEIEPANEHVLNNMGMYYAERGDFEIAEHYFLNAVAIDQYYEIARSNLAVLYHGQKRYDDAIQHLMVLAKIDPANPSYQYDLGINTADQVREHGIGNLNAAIAYFERADSLQPGYLSSRENIVALRQVMEN